MVSEDGYVRLKHIIGRPSEGIPAIIPINACTWYAWVASGKAPAGILLGPNVRVWRRADVIAMVESHK